MAFTFVRDPLLRLTDTYHELLEKRADPILVGMSGMSLVQTQTDANEARCLALQLWPWELHYGSCSSQNHKTAYRMIVQHSKKDMNGYEGYDLSLAAVCDFVPPGLPFKCGEQ